MPVAAAADDAVGTVVVEVEAGDGGGVADEGAYQGAWAGGG